MATLGDRSRHRWVFIVRFWWLGEAAGKKLGGAVVKELVEEAMEGAP